MEKNSIESENTEFIPENIDINIENKSDKSKLFINYMKKK
jgi:hypothetical protein